MTSSAANSPDLVVVGNLIVDDVVYPDGRTQMGQAGGSVIHVALGAALWGCSVGIVSVAGSDYPSEVLDALADRGIDLTGVERRSEPGMRTWLLYEGSRRRIVHRLEALPHEQGSPQPQDLPSGWAPSIVHLAPMPLPRQAQWLSERQSTESATFTIDPFVLVDASSWDDCIAVFSQADVLFISDDEVLLDDSDTRWPEVDIDLVLHKRGKDGGIAFDNQANATMAWPGRAGEVVEPTGAGDGFAGGFLAGLINGDSVDEALQKAVVSAAFALESNDVAAHLSITANDAESRRRQWFG